MRTIALCSALALGAMTAGAMAEPATTTPAKPAVATTAPVKVVPGQAGRLELNDRQMDGVKAGARPTPGSAGYSGACLNPGGHHPSFCST